MSKHIGASLAIHSAFNIPIEESDLRWIGTLSVLWSQVEYLVEAWIYHLQDLSFEEGRITELPRDVTRKSSKLKALAGDHLSTKERKIVTNLCDRIIAIAPLRNLAVHGNWCRLSDHNNVPAAVSWFKVAPGDPVTKLLPSQLPEMALEVGAISRGLYDVLLPRGAMKIGER